MNLATAQSRRRDPHHMRDAANDVTQEQLPRLWRAAFFGRLPWITSPSAMRMKAVKPW
jgi:hypothetical protein